MGTEKRDRQKANRAKRLEELAKEQKRDRRASTFRSLATLVGLALAIGAAIIWFTNREPEITAVSLTTTTTAAPTTTAVLDSSDVEGLTAQYIALRELPVACGGTLPSPLTPMSFEEAADMGIDPAATVTATVTTSCGDMVLDLDPAAAPIAVNSFVFLAREGYFDGVASHRIAPGFVLQIGDQTATGSGGPGYRFEDELPADSSAYVKGALAMANSGPNTNGSQFFIDFADVGLGPDFTVFGQLTSGDDVLAAIEQIPVTGDTPQEGLFIESIEVQIS
jgi:cyclophilin family peptidyl-prolyl cis-trans isomerase